MTPAGHLDAVLQMGVPIRLVLFGSSSWRRKEAGTLNEPSLSSFKCCSTMHVGSALWPALVKSDPEQALLIGVQTDRFCHHLLFISKILNWV